ncbi:hypothetical protein HMI54_013929 [Coelomomyces lativittatus]|nr:hypothetical protein HMI56_000537 [Coelomomyces lativittatus]KAJ1514577.1 hypothetical protein HMI54_013929 [Coelomomyces lativittatus]KAJ1516832.1 hypothetical protein HMI55_001284 [Coelomomyces lativittatus]
MDGLSKQRSKVQKFRSDPQNPKINFWGVDVMDGKVDERYVYDYTGRGVNVYILDSGLLSQHPGFPRKNAKVIWSKDGRTEDGDCEGHGSHLAGIVAGDVCGVAKEAQIMMLRIMDCDSNFNTMDLISALRFLQQNIVKPAVINFSFGSGKEMDDMKSIEEIRKIMNNITVTMQVPIIVSSGNNNSQKCDSVYDDVHDLIVVGSATKELKRSSFSNYGDCVDLYGPGEDIWSHANTIKGDLYAKRRGSSQATPFVSGVSALLMESYGKHLTPKELKTALLNAAAYKVPINNRLYPMALTPMTKETKIKIKNLGDKESNASSFSNIQLPVIIGVSAGVPLFILGFTLLFCHCRKKNRKKMNYPGPR